MKCKPHYHFVDLPNGRRVRTNKDCHINGDDEEMGSLLGTLGSIVGGGLGTLIAPGIGTAIGAGLGGAAGGALGKKKKKGAPAAAVPPEMLAAGLDIKPLEKNVDEIEDKVDDSIDLIKNLLATVPDIVRNQVMDALKTASVAQLADKAASDKNINAIVSNVNSAFAPQMATVLKLLKVNRLQNQATQEHKAKVKKLDSDKIQHAILNKVSRIETANKKYHAAMDKKISLMGRSLGKARLSASLFGVPTRLL